LSLDNAFVLIERHPMEKNRVKVVLAKKGCSVHPSKESARIWRRRHLKTDGSS
jgi:hypothetical protein